MANGGADALTGRGLVASERWEVVPTANGEPFDPTTTSATNALEPPSRR